MKKKGNIEKKKKKKKKKKKLHAMQFQKQA